MHIFIKKSDLFNFFKYLFRKSATWKKFADSDLVSKFEDLKCTLISSEKSHLLGEKLSEGIFISSQHIPRVLTCLWENLKGIDLVHGA